MRNTEEEKHVIKDDEETFETLETFKRHEKTNLSYDKSKCNSNLFNEIEQGVDDKSHGPDKKTREIKLKKKFS